MKQSDKSLLIDKFVTGKLEDTELWEFKADIEKDQDLAKEVELRKEVYNAIKNEDKISFYSNLKNLKENNTTRKFKLSIHSRQLQAIAAGVIMMLMVGTGIFTGTFNGNQNMNLYSEYFIEEGNLLSTRSISDATKDEVKSGIQYYEDNEYQKALSVFETMPQNLIARLYSGFTYMKTENFVQSENQFKYILDHGDNIFIDQAEWNLGLVYLAQNKTDNAIEMFTKISTSDSAYKESADKLLKELKN